MMSLIMGIFHECEVSHLNLHLSQGLTIISTQKNMRQFRSSLIHEDIENRTFEIRSHSAHHCLTLRACNSMEADSWFVAKMFTF